MRTNHHGHNDNEHALGVHFTSLDQPHTGGETDGVGVHLEPLVGTMTEGGQQSLPARKLVGVLNSSDETGFKVSFLREGSDGADVLNGFGRNFTGNLICLFGFVFETTVNLRLVQGSESHERQHGKDDLNGDKNH